MMVKPLVVSVLALMTCGVQAAGLDRSGQSILPFLQSGNYLEVGASYLSPQVGGKDTSGNTVPEMAEDYHFLNAAMKADINEQFRIGVLYDQPYGAAAKYQGKNNFNADGKPYALSANAVIPSANAIGAKGTTQVDVTSHSVTTLLGVNLNPQVMLYGGIALESIEGELDLRGPAYGPLNGYSADIKEDSSAGYVAGFAFEKPEIALKFALTYRSEIEHKLKAEESLVMPTAALAVLQNTAYAGVAPALVQADATQKLAQVNAALAANPSSVALQTQKAQLEGAVNLAKTAQLPTNQTAETKITTPQSVNLDFQTGIMKDTLAFANVRWVNWSKFSVKPSLFAKATESRKVGGLNVVDYTDDQWSATVGVGRKLTPQVSGSVSVGWDSGAGNPITTLGPTEGYWNLGVGVRYSPIKDVDVSLGAKYFWLGDADAKITSGTKVGEFEGNDAVAVGLKLGYHF